MRNSISRPLILCAALALVTLVSGCASTPFTQARPNYDNMPEDQVRLAAAEIEAAIARGEREPVLSEYEGVVLDTPEVKQAIRARAARVELLHEFLQTGFAAEQPGGLVDIKGSRAYKDATTRQQRDRNALVVYSENQNRWALYEGIMKASNWPKNTLGGIQRIFYDARLRHLPDGAAYELEDGTVVRKG